ncbi:substrate-binding domain-containing protein [Paenibacillus frigoriresistens]|uniref:substrate-binding domain-containing protein n=1 Tax=Paenibacillus alginolyticus TaxID=59839 RepID=UPI001565AD48|nr:substrate-binding domain-containing protein [Paenibacillus frigoriresistens]NRF96161.1 substrate-binding domain-containing protein [Paenibacillus frigoriresistens]
MNKRVLRLILTCILIIHFLTACSFSNHVYTLPSEKLTKMKPESYALPPSKKEITIGFTSLGNFEYIDMLKTNIIKEAEKQHVVLLNYDGKASGEQQLGDIKDMIRRKVDVIILNPVDTNKSIDAVKIATEAGIPVVGINTIANTDLLTTYIGSNDIQAGEMIMQYMAEKLNGKGNIVILQGLLKQSSQIQRGVGIANVLERYPHITLLEEKSANWSKSEAYLIMKDWYSAYGDKIHGVIALNDDMALGALTYLKEIGKQKEIPIIGVDAIQNALTAIKNGDMAATLFQNAEGQAKLAVGVAITIVKGGKPANSYFLPYQLVIPENIDHYLP